MVVLVFFTPMRPTGLRKAERLNRLKSDLINNMTHELKTPISTIGLAGRRCWILPCRQTLTMCGITSA